MSTTLRFLCAFGSVFAGGCFVVEDGPLNDVRDKVAPDMGAFVHTAEACATVASDPLLVPLEANTTTQISLEGLSNDFVSRCSTVVSDGPDAFLKIDGQAGQFWHFHVHRETGDADPVVGLFPIDAQGNCNTLLCNYVQDLCDDTDEHFGVRLGSSGSWALAVDSHTPGTTGTFSVTAYQPTCGDGNQVHGENCDDMNLVDDDDCDNSCRVVYKADFPESNINNDQYFADRVIPTPGNANGIVITGAVDKCDSDYFAVVVPAGYQLKVRALMAGGQSDEPYSAAQANFRADVLNASAVAIANMSQEAVTGAAVVNPTIPSGGGLYFVRMRNAMGVPDLKTYTIRVSLQ